MGTDCGSKRKKEAMMRFYHRRNFEYTTARSRQGVLFGPDWLIFDSLVIDVSATHDEIETEVLEVVVKEI